MLNKNKSFRVKEICVSYRDSDIFLPENHIESAPEAVEVFRFLGEKDREYFCSLHLTCRHRVIGFETVHIGTVNGCLACPRDIFKTALLLNSSKIVICHNHPSGDCKPSREDARLTRELKKACRLLDIELLDHIVIGDDGYFSFGEHGLI